MFYTFAIWELWIIEFGVRPLSNVGAVTKRTCEISSTCSHNVVNFGALVVEFGLPVWAPQQISTGFACSLHYCTDVAQWTSTKLCTMFGCLLASTLYAFSGVVAP